MWRKFDWGLMAALFFLAGFSLLALFPVQPKLFWAQLSWYVLGFLIIILAARINWDWLLGRNWFQQFFYWFAVFLLVATYFWGRPVRGTRSWLFIGSWRFQSSELMKVALILLFAGFFARRYLEVSRVKNILSSFFYFAAPAGLIALQPDFGVILILFVIWFGFLAVSGLRWRRLLSAVLIFILLFSFGWVKFLKSYQKERILGFLLPQRDPLGANYNVIQSKIAVGSAGWFGKGFGRGTQVQLGFLPEAQTDFIFSAFTEEWGLLGGSLVLLIFLFILFRIIKVGLKARGNCAKFICLGAVLVFAFQFFLNIGSCLGFSPVVGATLPFFSYGGSSILTCALLIGIIQHISLESSF